MSDKENGKTFAGNIGPSWGGSDEVKQQFAELATQQDVINYVVNAFKNWHAPDHEMLGRVVKTLDTMLLFLQERGLHVPERHIPVEVKVGDTDVVVTVTIPAHNVTLQPADIQAWALEKQAAAAAALTPKDQQA